MLKLGLFVCVVLVASVFGTAATPCNAWIAANNRDHYKNSTVYVSTTGSDSDTGDSLSSALLTIEQVRDCYSHNTTMYLAPGTYRVPPMANMSKIPAGLITFAEEDDPPYFKVIGDSQATTTINVTSGDFSDLHIVDSASTSEVLYVYQAIFDFVNITADIQSSPSDPHSTLYWVHDSIDDLSHLGFDNVKFIGNSANFPKHLIVHTGGELVLKTVVIAPTDNVLPCNIIYWFGSSTGAIHKGQWLLENVTLRSNTNGNNMSYTYGNSLFEVDDLSSLNCNLTISLTKSTFENIKWDNSAPLRRQSNADPIGLVFTLKNTNNGSVTITDSSFIRLNLNLKPNAAPVAVVSLTTAITEPLIFDSVTFSNNVGNSGGAIASIDGSTSVKIKGNSKFEGNKVGSTENDFGTAGGVFDLSEETIGGVGGDGVVVNKPGGDEPDGLPPWALPVIIAVAAVVVVAIVVIIIAGVYFRKKKYSQLTDDIDEFSESNSGSLRSSEKDNEMDSI